MSVISVRRRTVLPARMPESTNSTESGRLVPETGVPLAATLVDGWLFQGLLIFTWMVKPPGRGCSEATKRYLPPQLEYIAPWRDLAGRSTRPFGRISPVGSAEFRRRRPILCRPAHGRRG